MKICQFILAFFFCYGVFGQQDSIAIINLGEIEQIVENQELEGDLDLDNLYEELSYIAEKPYNINSVTIEELVALALLTELQLAAFFEYRSNYGPFISMYELQSIPHWNILTIERVKPFLTAEERILINNNIDKLFKNGRHTISYKWKYVLQERAGFDATRSPDYQGDRNHLYLRYRYNFNNKLRWGLTAEKDAGETFFSGEKNYGFDYYSGFIHYYDPRSIIESISLGDYTLSIGQGLISHNAFGAGKSTEAVNIKRSGRAIRPYSSVNEVNFLRGVASQIRIHPHVKLIALSSFKNIDGTINQDTTLEDGFESFSSLTEDGYHRTLSEIEKKNSIFQKTFGGIIRYEIKDFKIGFNYIRNVFDKPLEQSDQLYRKFYFDGKKLTNASIDFSWRIKNSNIFGELARSDNGGTAYLITSQSSLHPKVDLTISFRNYQKDYQVLNPNAFGESRNAVNERGLYVGAAIYLSRNFTLRGYHDSWSHPWLKFRVDSPSSGRESVLRLEYNKKRKHQFYIQYKNEYKSRNSSSTSSIREVEMTQIQRLRIHFNNIISPALQLRNRIELSKFNSMSNNSSGWLLYQDIIYKPAGSKISFACRYALFDTDDFDSRIYAFENDIQYEFRIPFFQNRGTRIYFHSRYKFSNKLSFEARIDRTYIQDAEQIGSSGEAIIGNVRNEVKAQIIYRIN